MNLLPVVVDFGFYLIFVFCYMTMWLPFCLYVILFRCVAMPWSNINVDMRRFSVVCCRWYVVVFIVLFACNLMMLFYLDLKLISTCVVLARSTLDSSSPFLFMDLFIFLPLYLFVCLSIYFSDLFDLSNLFDLFDLSNLSNLSDLSDLLNLSDLSDLSYLFYMSFLSYLAYLSNLSYLSISPSIYLSIHLSIHFFSSYLILSYLSIWSIWSI